MRNLLLFLSIFSTAISADPITNLKVGDKVDFKSVMSIVCNPKDSTSALLRSKRLDDGTFKSIYFFSFEIEEKPQILVDSQWIYGDFKMIPHDKSNKPIEDVSKSQTTFQLRLNPAVVAKVQDSPGYYYLDSELHLRYVTFSVPCLVYLKKT